MVKERILDWVTEQIPPFKKKGRPTYGRLPTNIIYYRDGVSDPQFLDVQSQELSAIERAFRDAYDELKLNGTINSFELDECPKVNITALVCIKRHGTRFYPLSGQADGNGNCPPGTQVESVVTSPFFMDFYLQSHAAIKGTAKPCHYFVLRNDMQLSLTDLRMLTHELCYTYVRAPCGVSYASPAYYADRLCERGRIYLRDLYQRTDRGAALHTQFKEFKWDEEDAREAVRVREFGNLRNDDGSARRKTEMEVKMEETHRKEVEELCDQWALGKARRDWYGDENEPVGQNPWHQNISKTMFWM
jgi:eukaryotic translation initiation factor 2C